MNTDISLPTVSVIMPCLNEEDNVCGSIMDVLQEFDLKQLVGEIIVVNDGSTDNSVALIEAISDHRVTLLNKEENEGIGKAFSDGIRHAKNKYVVMIPADNENAASEVFAYYYLVTDVDLVVPFVHNSEVRRLSRRLISALYRFMINISFGTSLNYTNGTVIYNRHALNTVELRSSGFFYQTELLIKLLRCGFLYAEVPQVLGNRSGGNSKALTMGSLLSLFASFIRLVIDVHILRIEGMRPKSNNLPAETATYKRYSRLRN